MTLRTAFMAVSALTASLCLTAPAFADAPRLEAKGDTQQLIVNGKPLLMIAGELSNSASSSAAYMEPHWKRLKDMNLNTVLTPVSWELIEPVEGTFDWSSVDFQIKAARANNLKLVILWFGAWKNSMSTYVPAWVKRDQRRFPRAELPNGQGWRSSRPSAPRPSRRTNAPMPRSWRISRRWMRRTTPSSWCRWRTRSACCRSRGTTAPPPMPPTASPFRPSW